MDDVAISIVCTNNAALLAGCLNTLAAACDGLRWRVTVVDNASTDGTFEIVREQFDWATVVRNDSRRGFAYNHNRTIVAALDRSDVRYVLVLNDDTLLDPGSVCRMVREMDEVRNLGALGPRIRGVDGSSQQSLFGFPSVGHLLLHQFCPARPPGWCAGVGWLNGSCLLLRLEALAEVGPLDESYFIFFEDTDLGLRLADAGWLSAVSRDAGMVHLGHETVKIPELSRIMARQMLRSQWLYVVRRKGRPAALVVSAGTRLALVLRCLKSVVCAVLGDHRAWAQAGLFISLAAYRPARLLSHESSS